MSRIDDDLAPTEDDGRGAEPEPTDEVHTSDPTVLPSEDLVEEPTEANESAGGNDEAPATGAPRPQRKKRSQKRREWHQVERARRHAARKSVRFPIFTRSVLLWLLIFAMVGMAFGASGAFWWAHFNTQVAQLRDDTKDFEQREQGAAAAIDAQRNQALTQVNDALAPLSGVLADAKTVQLAQSFSPSVWFVSTYDDAGLPSVGSAFALVSDDNEALMVTSFGVIRAATLNPGPEIKVSKITKDGSEEIKAELWATDEQHDLALLLVKRGGIPVLEWATDDVQAKAKGSRVYAVSGYGGDGAALSPGMVLSTSAEGFQHTASIGSHFRGGPMITSDGKITGVASLDYRPGNFDPGEVHFSIPINTVCTKVMECGGGQKKRRAKQVDPPADPRPPAAGAQPTPSPAPAPGAPAPSQPPPSGRVGTGND